MSSSFFVNTGGSAAEREAISNDLTASANSKADAQKLAINPEDSQFTLSDATTTGNSALHHAAKAEASATSATGSASTATQQAGIATQAKTDAQAATAAALLYRDSAIAANNNSVLLTGAQTIAGAKTFSNALTVNDTVTTNGLTVDLGTSNTTGTIQSSTGNAQLNVKSTANTAGDDYGIIEVSGTDGAYIDIAKPDGTGYDLRIQHLDENNSVVVADTSNLIMQVQDTSRAVILKHGANSPKLTTTTTGIDVNGTVTATGLDLNGAIDLDANGADCTINTQGGGLTIDTASNNAIFSSDNHGRQFQIICDSTNDTACPDLVLRKSQDTSGDDEFSSGNIRFENAHNDGYNQHAYASITSYIVDQGASETDRTEADAQIRFAVMDGNDSTTALKNPQNRLLVNKNGIVVNSSNSSTGAEVLNVLTTSHEGIDVTGTVTADGLTSSGVVGIGGQTGTLKLGNDATYYADIEWEYNNSELAFTANSGANFTFNSNGSERMRIKSSGAVDIGGFATTGAVDGVQINGDGSGIQSKAATTGFSYHNRFYNSNGQVGYIITQNSTTTYATSSDYRLKTDAQPMTGATDRLKQLNPVNFQWIADGTRVDGFLAHEAQAVVPESVTGTKDAMKDEEYEVTPAVLDADDNVVTEAVMGTRSVPEYQGIDQAKLVPLLVATIQELEARITALEA